MLSYCEHYLIGVIKGENKGVFVLFLKPILRVLSWGFRFVAFCRNLAFDRGWLRRYYPPVPVVISIGNLVSGGTGKTPVTLFLAKQFYHDTSLAILSRGYRSPAENIPLPVLISKGEGPIFPASYCGDEPYLLSQHLPKAAVFVGRDRYKASVLAAKSGAQMILIDDGMQHRRLARDLEVVVVDASDPFGQGYCLPRGFLREGVRGLKRADLIVLNHITSRAHYLSVKHKIARYSSAPVVGMQMESAAIENLQGRELGSLQGKKVGIFCGIARPEHFKSLVEKQGARIVAEQFFLDHRVGDEKSLQHFSDQAKELGAELLLCTEKDKVKIFQGLTCSLPVACLKLRLQIIEGAAYWNEFLQKVRASLKG